MSALRALETCNLSRKSRSPHPQSGRRDRALLERHSRPMRRLESTATVGTDPVCVRLRDVQRPFSDLHDPTNDKPVGYVSNFHLIH